MLTQAYVQQLFAYDAETGDLIWRVSRTNRFPAGAVAGGVSRTTRGGYIYERRYISIDGRKYLAHHIVWLHVRGAWPSVEIDHRDGDALNNRLDNLREATRSQNAMNVGRRAPRSGFRGVSQNGSGFAAGIHAAGKYHYIGQFRTAEQAHEAYQRAAKDLHGEFKTSR